MKKIVSIPIYVLILNVLLFSKAQADALKSEFYTVREWRPFYHSKLSSEFAGIICHPQVQISLDHSGKVKIKPEMLLTVSPVNPANFTVLIQGTKTDTISCNDLGQKLKVYVFENGTSNSCWTYVYVEDKTAPFVICRDTTVLCTGMQSDLDSIPNITVIGDNCTPLSEIRISKMDRIVVRDCADDTFSVVTRMWSAIDPWGRAGSCIQTIKLLRGQKSDIQFPKDTTVFCPVSTISPVLLGQPTLGGKPLDKFCGWLVEYEDVVYTKCGESKKILRVWKVLDCCDVKDTLVTQFILINDTTPPSVVCPLPYTVSTDDNQCAATLKLKTLLSARDACNGSNIDVWIKIDDATLHTPGSIIELGAGLHLLEYQAADPCGNKVNCKTSVEVKDDDPPTIICPDSIFISLPSSNVFIEPKYFSSIEYYDNCEIQKIEFKKSIDNCLDGIDDTVFNDTIHVCCDEINEIFDIIFKVTDTTNNMSTCTVKAYVVDKTAPILNSEQNDTVKCGLPRPDWTDPALGLVDNCLENVKITIDTILNNFNLCGLGTIKRRIIATDPGGNADTVCQSITVNEGDGMDNTAFCALISWPKDTTLANCNIKQHPDSLKLRPVFTPDPTHCTKAIFSYRDTSVANQIMGGCLNTTLRIWTALDECSMTLMCKDTQRINVLDTDAPLLVVPADKIINLKFPSLCDTLLTSLGSAIAADCDPNVIIKNVILGTMDTAGASLIRRYPMGISKVLVYAQDACGNISKDTVMITVKDTIKPKAVCQKFNSYLNDQGFVRINSNQVNNGSSDNCTPADQLKFSWTKNLADTILEVDCNHFILKRPSGDTILDTVPYFGYERYFTIWVTDASGNQDTCNGNRSLAFLDTLNICGKNRLVSGFHGHVTTLTGYNIPDVTITASGERKLLDKSDLIGRYHIESYKPGKFKLEPYKNDDPISGVSTMDLLQIQKHIGGIERFSSVDQYISADINNDGDISITDLIELRKLILGIRTVFSNNTSWRFYNETLIKGGQDEYTLKIFENPFIEAVPGHMIEQNFNGIKIGDVNKSLVPGLTIPENRSSSKLDLDIENNLYKSNELVQINISTNLNRIQGIQGELKVSNADIISISENSFINSYNYNSSLVHQGIVRFNWFDLSQRNSITENIIQLVIRPRTEGHLSDFIKLNNKGLCNEAYSSNNEILDLNLNFTNPVSKNKNIGLSQTEGAHPKTVFNGLHSFRKIDVFVFPNPVESELNIRFNELPVSAITWKILDQAGKLLRQGKANAGLPIFKIPLEGLQTGFYILDMGDGQGVPNRIKIIKK